MHTSSLLWAQMLSVPFLLVGIGFLLNSEYYRKMYKDFIKMPSTIFTWGVLTTVLGLAMVVNHNVWNGAWWTTLITVLGILTLVKGLFLLVFPNVMEEMAKPWLKSSGLMYFSGAFTAVLGLILGYYGFIA